MNYLLKLLGGCLIISCCSVQASVVLGGTRIIYPSNKSEVQIALKNKDPHTRYLVQSWVSYPNDAKAPFIITPPVYKLQENRQTLLHIIFTGDKKNLPADRESLFLANVKSVSALSPDLKDKNTLQFAMKTRLKLFWRPADLKAMRYKPMKKSPSAARGTSSLRKTQRRFTSPLASWPWAGKVSL